LQPNLPVSDPLKSISAPTKPATAGTKVSVAKGTPECPARLDQSCTIYYPGDWSGGIDVKGETAIFQPGLYYIDSKGFAFDSNSASVMCSATCVTSGPLADTTSGCCTTSKGMLVYLDTSGGALSVGANAGKKDPIILLGSDKSGTYKGILFFASHSNGSSHSFGGGGATTVTGTLYLTNSALHTQSLSLGGGSGSNTTIIGQIITDQLSLSGNSAITMTLDASSTFPVDRVSLVK
jgi:hypothetical protein